MGVWWGCGGGVMEVWWGCGFCGGLAFVVRFHNLSYGLSFFYTTSQQTT